MAWSTRQLAKLTDSTVKAIRHYHEIGLLDEPERAANGYKQYKVAHLIRMLQIKRLRDLGVSLSQIAAMERADEDPDEAIRLLDAELAATIERLNRVRAELAVILRHRAPMHVPPMLAPISQDLSDREQSLLTVYSAVFSEESMEKFRQIIAEDDDIQAALDALPPDADDAAIARLAERMAPMVRRSREKHPWLNDLMADSPLGVELAGNTLAHAVVEFYSPAQIRVMQRVNAILEKETAADDDQTPPKPHAQA
ncbi:MerR family transcriptional regulator [Nonomuraea sp. KC401]|uniref:helix-turn-helix domain-containing protein n=1 Tax=unclassified Nonomuraea TaxID=2593643 RepID=UPI0010FDF85A|nr:MULTISPECIES: MerR family transcriptional regulator [unclassified Nonomuraea]NBE96912.1 MerR family transcriptional regulator [Nonomuraea sp. K271]TLF66321.1 MerR family transcriptional regulator [Nonomuraea sp. KC401]